MNIIFFYIFNDSKICSVTSILFLMFARDFNCIDFLRNQLAVSFIFSVAFLFKFHVFLLWSSLYTSFWLIWAYLLFSIVRLRTFLISNVSFRATYLSFNTILLESHIFWYIVFLFSLSSKYFLFLIRLPFLKMNYSEFRSVLFCSRLFGNIPVKSVIDFLFDSTVFREHTLWF